MPPHVPWALLALGIGGYECFSYWRIEEELVELEGKSPRCGMAQAPELPARLTRPFRIASPSCHTDLHLEVAATT